MGDAPSAAQEVERTGAGTCGVRPHTVEAGADL